MLLTACEWRERQKSEPLFNMQLPKESTHLDLQWPAIRDETPAVHFRIPREDLDVSRIRGDKPGEVNWVFLELKLPESLGRKLWDASNSTKRRPRPSPPPGRTYLKIVELMRIPNDASMRVHRYDSWGGGDCNECIADGVVMGLARYSKKYCLGPAVSQSDPAVRESLRKKPKDDPSPLGCWVNRYGSYLSNSIKQDQGERGVDIRCASGSCDMNVQIEGRKVYTSLRTEQLVHAEELAHFIRARLSQYVVQ